MHFIACLLSVIFLFVNPINAYADDIFYGFIPFWGVLLLMLSGFFLMISIFGLVGYFLGCRTPLARRHPPSTNSTAPFYITKNCSIVI